MFSSSSHYSVPKIPSIKDIEKFCGRQTHSHDYREPEPFKGERVVILGAGPSGVDISLEVAAVAKEVIVWTQNLMHESSVCLIIWRLIDLNWWHQVKGWNFSISWMIICPSGSYMIKKGSPASELKFAFQVILSHNHPIQIPSELPANVRQTRGIVAAYENGFIFGDGSQAEADVLIYCTGRQWWYWHYIKMIHYLHNNRHSIDGYARHGTDPTLYMNMKKRLIEVRGLVSALLKQILFTLFHP